MIKTLVEVTGNIGTLSVMVYAKNLRQAVELVADRYPSYAVSVQFPLDPDLFFVQGPAVGTEMVESVAAEPSQYEQGRSEAIETNLAGLPSGSAVGTIISVPAREEAPR